MNLINKKILYVLLIIIFTGTANANINDVLKCKLGLAEACFNAGVDYDKKHEIVKAEQYYTKACNKNYSSACYNLAITYEESKNYNKAINYYNKACTLGHTKACEYASLLKRVLLVPSCSDNGVEKLLKDIYHDSQKNIFFQMLSQGMKSKLTSIVNTKKIDFDIDTVTKYCKGRMVFSDKSYADIEYTIEVPKEQTEFDYYVSITTNIQDLIMQIVLNNPKK